MMSQRSKKEVVERIMAEPPKMSLLSISVQFYAEVEKIMDVKTAGQLHIYFSKRKNQYRGTERTAV